MTTSFETWKSTDLWKKIKEKSDNKCELTINSLMPIVESVLKSGGTSSLDFTLHDNEHGFRVAQMMASIIPIDIIDKLGSIELSMLLFSAYLHDIGMTPGRDIVKNHFRYITTGENSLLSPSEIKNLQNWLDEERDGQEIPVDPKKITSSFIEEAEEIVAYYCRHKHNDWSEAWIRENLSDFHPGLYPAWIDDLVTLCRSHHDGIAELRTDKFNSRMTGSPSQVVNLRYLAAVLRVADVLEFDPERTPDVILKHRDISATSRKYWYKDKEISFQIDQDRNQIHLSARTPDATIHKAVLDTARWVDQELLCCSALQQEGAFLRGSIPEKYRFHNWPWPSKLALDISERDKSFVFIDGAFRPNTNQILDLLSGTALYGNPFAAVRELLQNAFDAVKEQIARERLSQDDPENSEWENHLGKMHKVSLFLEKDNDEYWLVCNDSGVGMTKHIIEKYLLVSGSSKQADVMALERAAKRKGFSSGRTGQFGIGVLSYFMISDRLVVRTRRSAEAGGDPDNTGWQFSIGGIDTFGQLSPISRSARGTEVRLRIKSNTDCEDINEWTKRAREYIFSTVRKVPCRFENRLSEISIQQVGWTQSAEAFKSDIVEDLSFRRNNYSDEQFVTTQEEDDRRYKDERWRDIRENALKCLKIETIDAGILPGELGSYRITVPFFSVNGRNFFVFLMEEEGVIHAFPDERYSGSPKQICHISWKGFSVENLINTNSITQKIARSAFRFKIESNFPFIAEIDLVQGAKISVNRNELEMLDYANIIPEFISKKINDIALTFMNRYNSKNNEMINLAFLKDRKMTKNICNIEGFSVPVISCSKGGPNPNTLEWKVLSGPIAEPLSNITDAVGKIGPPRWCDNEIHLIPRFNETRYDSLGNNEFSIMDGYPCDQIAVSKAHHRQIMLFALWNNTGNLRTYRNFKEQQQCDFPPEWDRIPAIITSRRIVLNKNNRIVLAINEESLEWLIENNVSSHENFEKSMKDACLSKARSAAWFIVNAGKGSRFFIALDDRFPNESSTIKRHLKDCYDDESDLSAVWTSSYSYFGTNSVTLLSDGKWTHYEYTGFTEGSMRFKGNIAYIPIPKDNNYWIGQPYSDGRE